GEFNRPIAIAPATAATRLASMRNVTNLAGHSPEVLRGLAPQLASEGVLYWLAAKRAPETAGQQHACLLVEELAAIGKLNESSVVLIDDARLFLAPPPPPLDQSKWPLLDEVTERLKALSPDHRLWVINDVFVFAPAKAYDAVVEYGRTRGVQLDQLAGTAANTRPATGGAG